MGLDIIMREQLILNETISHPEFISGSLLNTYEDSDSDSDPDQVGTE
jgi:hypothetical protein